MLNWGSVICNFLRFINVFYILFVVDTKETSEILKKNGDLEKRPRRNTCDYFEYFMTKV
ncbi:hypothetical protein HL033_01110 [Neoehrlichia mikurensis]|uniref:SecY family transport protein n=1 Tax=Neoehrlichia mikurensis TaxID=89586 RepID=A0A9Q9BYB8_9RICK|nr:SecY family transport protein [Neoehrlichia mikurensis]QXK92161.1 hypothetical protein IAH97_01105 [Neoehrlichia mikurensis]QXK93855.1 hypothetical protein HL033_01110 [Neoehrlichia mikurensis]UTO55149.1 SecY family transport protein [Neoehrlichia mikurensis]